MNNQTCETCRHWGSHNGSRLHMGVNHCSSKQSPDAGQHWGRNHKCAKWEAREEEE